MLEQAVFVTLKINTKVSVHQTLMFSVLQISFPVKLRVQFRRPLPTFYHLAIVFMCRDEETIPVVFLCHTLFYIYIEVFRKMCDYTT